MRLISLLLIAMLAASACSTTKAGQGGDKKSQKAGKLKKKRPPFKAPPLESLPDLGELRAPKLASIGSSLKKLCPARKKGKPPGGCVCLSVGETSSSEVWEDNVASCSSPVEGLKPPLQSLQFLAAQAPLRRKKGEPPALGASFRLLLQTRKGWFAADLGSTEQQEGAGYPRTLKLVSMDFVDFAAGEAPGLLATFEERITAAPAASEDGAAAVSEKSVESSAAPSEASAAPSEASAAAATSRGLLVACIAIDAKKLGCTEPIPLGAPKRKGGYPLGAVVEGGHLYLVETTASIPEDIKSRSGKYTLTAP